VARRRALRSPSEEFLQAIAKSLGVFGGLRSASVSHIDEQTRASLEVIHEASHNPEPKSPIYRTPILSGAGILVQVPSRVS